MMVGMKTISKLTLLLMIVLLALSACAPATPTPIPATPTPEALVLPDGLGGEIGLAQPAGKIISLAPSNTELLYAVGAGKQVVARDDFSNYPEESSALPTVGGNMGSYSLEQMVTYQPDLVLVSPLTAPEVIKGMQDLKLPVLVVPNPTTLDEMYANLELVGKATGHADEAAKLVVDLRAREKTILEAVATASAKPLVFYELDATEPAKPWTSGPGTFVDLLLGMAGAQNLGAELQGEWAQISQEELIVKNPDVILLGDALYGGITAESVAARPGWAEIKAVKENKVFAFNDDLVSRPGPRMVEGLAELVKVLHPELADQLK
jgi:iron complex transport system substrate-binding protein